MTSSISLRVDVVRPRRIAIDQRRVAENVDHARNAVTGIGDRPAGFIGEQVDARAGGAQAEADIFADLIAPQSLEMEIRRDALRELQQFRSAAAFP